ncbi:MAG TPA: methylmalonyl Co-A mutase-associated GTPase MeaB [Bacteroidia bacterium]|nr:methylmalonyl Co-A mutase-associated GTPase MeaB [Bacteroidia bacterium]
MTVLNASHYIEGILQGDVVLLSKAITLTESLNIEHQVLASKIIDGIIHKTGQSFRLGITGVPGVGKSSFIEKFGQLLLNKGHRLAVLAVDPTSSRTKGSILGDKTRMTELSARPDVYIRPSPSGGTLGGVTRSTYESMLLCEAAGYDFIIIETVGVGQSEVAVSGFTDFFLLLMLAGAGDELQGIKRGIMEMADALVITKADGDNLEKSKIARSEYAQALHLFQTTAGGWTPRSLICSSQSGLGMKEVLEMIEEYKQAGIQNGNFQSKRKQQQLSLFNTALEEEIRKQIFRDPMVLKSMREIADLSRNNNIQPFAWARKVADAFLDKLK